MHPGRRRGSRRRSRNNWRPPPWPRGGVASRRKRRRRSPKTSRHPPPKGTSLQAAHHRPNRPSGSAPQRGLDALQAVESTGHGGARAGAANTNQQCRRPGSGRKRPAWMPSPTATGSKGEEESLVLLPPAHSHTEQGMAVRFDREISTGCRSENAIHFFVIRMHSFPSWLSLSTVQIHGNPRTHLHNVHTGIRAHIINICVRESAHPSASRVCGQPHTFLTLFSSLLQIIQGAFSAFYENAAHMHAEHTHMACKAPCSIMRCVCNPPLQNQTLSNSRGGIGRSRKPPPPGQGSRTFEGERRGRPDRGGCALGEERSAEAAEEEECLSSPLYTLPCTEPFSP